MTLEENDQARAQIQHLWQNVKGDFAAVLAAPETPIEPEKVSALKRSLGSFQLVRFLLFV